MPGGDGAQMLRRGLLSDAHDQPVFAISAGVVRAANKMAAQLFGRDVPALALSELFDDVSVEKLRHLATLATPATSTELQVKCAAALKAVRFMVLAADDELIFVAARADASYPVTYGAQLMAAIEEDAILLRRLSRDVRSATLARETLQEMGRLRELFIAGLAHDLRAPLNAILLTEAVLRKAAQTVAPADLVRHAVRVERNVLRMIELIDKILLGVRLDASQPAFSVEPVKLDRVVQDWVETLAPIATHAAVDLNFSGRASPTVDADPVQLGEVVSNLLSNAIRHCAPTGHVVIEVATRGHLALCSVADDGPGVPAAAKEHIFDKFVQVSGARGSSGLGLYICRRIVELHHGKIWVEDNSPRGARFVFELPLAHSEKAP